MTNEDNKATEAASERGSAALNDRLGAGDPLPIGDGCPHGGITRDCPVCVREWERKHRRPFNVEITR